MVRQGFWKLCYTHRLPKEFELYNLENDPGEFTNLANQTEFKSVQEKLFRRVCEIWPDPDALDQRIRESQEERYLLRNLTTKEKDSKMGDENSSAIDYYAGIVNRGHDSVDKNNQRLF
jgi:choline-sulfatase